VQQHDFENLEVKIVPEPQPVNDELELEALLEKYNPNTYREIGINSI
jgi:hypothetical protein